MQQRDVKHPNMDKDIMTNLNNRGQKNAVLSRERLILTFLRM